MQTSDVQIRRARTLSDYHACIAIQKEVWRFADPEDYASVALMLVADRHGGSILVAEDSENRIQGFAYALLCRNPAGEVCWWSHMTAVSRAFQGGGVGFALKLAQRNEALRDGISEISWTFDPLRATNAYFNIRKLGGLADSYEPNLYGTSTSPLHHGLPTDRLEIRWHLTSERVVNRVQGTDSLILRDFDGIVRVFEANAVTPAAPNLGHTESPLLLEIPVVYPPREGGKTAIASQWQDNVRTAFTHYFGQGYAVTDFILIDQPGPQALYVLER